jgi:hypothetical protein
MRFRQNAEMLAVDIPPLHKRERPTDNPARLIA